MKTRNLEMVAEDKDPSEVDLQALKDLADKNSSRHGATMFLNDAVDQFVREHSLAVKEIPRWSPNHPRRVAIAKKETVQEAPKNIVSSVNALGISEKVKGLYEQIKTMPLVEAVEFLDQCPRLPRGNVETPEVAVLGGLIFGYKPCDIEYYLRTRYFGAPEHKYEQAANEKVEYVMCEKCAKKWLSEQNLR